MSQIQSPRLRTNIIANAVGRFFSLFVSIIATPFYIQFLGVEAYGLIGFYLTLQAAAVFLEMGMSRACVRELASNSLNGESGHQLIRETVRTLEVIYWAVAAILFLAIFFASGWIAGNWINTEYYSTAQVEETMLLVAGVIALRWPIGLYNAVLMGMQRHVLMNGIQIVMSIITNLGAILLLAFQPTIDSYFVWHIGMASLGLIVITFFAWKVIPGKTISASFSSQVISRIYPFTLGLGINTILGAIIRQADKLILSAILPLKEFGYYMIAYLIASLIPIIGDVVSNAVFPRFSQILSSKGKGTELSELYHLSSQLVASCIIPVSVGIAVLAPEVLYAYSGSEEIAKNAGLILTVLVLANMLHASMLIPYAIQLAYGWVRLSININIISAIILVPGVYYLGSKFGGAGAAMVWLGVTIGCITVGVPYMHKKILMGEYRRWILHTVLLPVVITVALFVPVSNWIDIEYSRITLIAVFILYGAFVACVTLMSSGLLRKYILNQYITRTQ